MDIVNDGILIKFDDSQEH